MAVEILALKGVWTNIDFSLKAHSWQAKWHFNEFGNPRRSFFFFCLSSQLIKIKKNNNGLIILSTGLLHNVKCDPRYNFLFLNYKTLVDKFKLIATKNATNLSKLF